MAMRYMGAWDCEFVFLATYIHLYFVVPFRRWMEGAI